MYGVNRDSITSISLAPLSVFHESPYFHVSDAFDAVYEMLDKQLFSDIVTNVFTGALVKIVQRGKTYPTR